jgi:hypothetical protein
MTSTKTDPIACNQPDEPHARTALAKAKDNLNRSLS